MTMKKVGLIAGNGKLPELFLNQCTKPIYSSTPILALAEQ